MCGSIGDPMQTVGSGSCSQLTEVAPWWSSASRSAVAHLLYDWICCVFRDALQHLLILLF